MVYNVNATDRKLVTLLSRYPTTIGIVSCFTCYVLLLSVCVLAVIHIYARGLILISPCRISQAHRVCDGMVAQLFPQGSAQGVPSSSAAEMGNASLQFSSVT